MNELDCGGTFLFRFVNASFDTERRILETGVTAEKGISGISLYFFSARTERRLVLGSIASQHLGGKLFDRSDMYQYQLHGFLAFVDIQTSLSSSGSFGCKI